MASFIRITSTLITSFVLLQGVTGATTTTTSAASSYTPVAGGNPGYQLKGRFRCGQAGPDGTTIADQSICDDPNLAANQWWTRGQCDATAYSTPFDVVASGSKNAGAVPVGSKCVQDNVNTNEFYCGMQGASCTSDAECDNGSCSASGTCTGTIGASCSTSADCLGNISCAENGLCGGTDVTCLVQDAYSDPNFLCAGGDSLCISNTCDQVTGTCVIPDSSSTPTTTTTTTLAPTTTSTTVAVSSSVTTTSTTTPPISSTTTTTESTTDAPSSSSTTTVPSSSTTTTSTTPVSTQTPGSNAAYQLNGRYRCAQAGPDGTTIADQSICDDPNLAANQWWTRGQCDATAFSSPFDVVASGSKGAGAVPVGSVCVQDAISPDEWFCGMAGASCTSDAGCDNGSCSAAGVCVGKLGDACSTSADCLGDISCGDDGLCGGDNAPCTVPDAYNTVGYLCGGGDGICSSNNCIQATGHCGGPSLLSSTSTTSSTSTSTSTISSTVAPSTTTTTESTTDAPTTSSTSTVGSSTTTSTSAASTFTPVAGGNPGYQLKGRYRCGQVGSDGTTIIADQSICDDPNLAANQWWTRDQCDATAYSSPFDVVASGSKGAGAVPVGSVCVQDTVDPTAFYCGLAGASCTSDANCDNGHCSDAGVCTGNLGDACSTSADCSGNISCASDGVCGGSDVTCLVQDAYSDPNFLCGGGDQLCVSNTCDQETGTCFGQISPSSSSSTTPTPTTVASSSSTTVASSSTTTVASSSTTTTSTGPVSTQTPGSNAAYQLNGRYRCAQAGPDGTTIADQSICDDPNLAANQWWTRG